MDIYRLFVFILVCTTFVIPGVICLSCYGCPSASTADGCRQTELCPSGDICMLRTLSNGTSNETYYETKCTSKTVCDDAVLQYQGTLASLVGRKRAYSSFISIGSICLAQCCDTDLCNNGCSSIAVVTRTAIPTSSTTPVLVTDTSLSTTTVGPITSSANPSSAMTPSTLNTTTVTNPFTPAPNTTSATATTFSSSLVASTGTPSITANETTITTQVTTFSQTADTTTTSKITSSEQTSTLSMSSEAISTTSAATAAPITTSSEQTSTLKSSTTAATSKSTSPITSSSVNATSDRNSPSSGSPSKGTSPTVTNIPTTTTQGSQASTTAPACPFGYIGYGESCYLFVKREMTFGLAKDYCLQESGYLLHINTKEENNFIVNTIQQLHRDYIEFWIGISDASKENEWRFTDTGEITTFFDWAPNQPDNQPELDGNVDSANCAVISPEHHYQWIDQGCSAYQTAEPICEKRSPGTP